MIEEFLKQYKENIDTIIKNNIKYGYIEKLDAKLIYYYNKLY